eukprot:1161001-Pelagomonas_calceolata.AAC.5
MAQASKKAQLVKQKNFVGRPPGDSSADVACMGSSVCDAEPLDAGDVNEAMHDDVQAEPASVGNANDARHALCYSDDTDELL